MSFNRSRTEEEKRRISYGMKMAIQEGRGTTQIKKGEHFSQSTEFKKGQLPWCAGKKCPSLSLSKSGDKHPAWKGGRYLDKNGYIYVMSKGHPRSNSRGYVFEHILVIEKKIGRFLAKEERVHHINEDKGDNRPENLELYKNDKEHARKHLLDRNRFIVKSLDTDTLLREVQRRGFTINKEEKKDGK